MTARVEGDSRLVGQRFYCTSTKLAQTLAKQATTVSGWMSAGELGYSPVKDAYGFGKDATTVSSGSDAGGGNVNGAGAVSQAKDRMKASSCVALSPDGRLLAVGEIGYQPRVFVYSTAADASASPLAILSEHRFGVRFAEFSPCGRFLATLGDVNDGFLHVWALGALRDTGSVSLHASNRCISTVYALKWLNGSQLVTAGVRHLRIWTVDGADLRNEPRVLAGRNVVAGSLSASTWASLAPVSEDVVAVASTSGVVCTVRVDEAGPDLMARLQLGTSVSAIDVDASSGRIWIARPSELTSLSLEEFLRSEVKVESKPELPASPSPSPSPSPTGCGSGLSPRSKNGISAVWSIGTDTAIVLSSAGEISTARADSDSDPDGSNKATSTNVLVASHGKEVLGLAGPRGDSAPDRFVTWSSDHTVGLWTADGECVQSVRVSTDADAHISHAVLAASGGQLFVGTTLGHVLVVDAETGQTLQTFEAHGSRVVGIDIADNVRGHSLFVTCSRDRTIQVYRLSEPGGAWALHQTLADHKGTLVAAQFTRDRRRIVSCSADRTANVYNIAFNDQGEMACVLAKVISLRASPLDMTVDDQWGSVTEQPDKETEGHFVISSDKHVHVFKDTTGDLVSSYRTAEDFASGDSVSLTSISLGSVGSRTFLAGTASDRSVRMYEHPTGMFAGSDWGHSEGVSGFAWLRSPTSCKLASSGVSGCVFLWTVDRESGPDQRLSSSGPGSPGRSSPTRKIMTKAELAKFLGVDATRRSSTPTKQSSPSPKTSPTRADERPPPRARSPTRSPTRNAATPVLAARPGAAETATPVKRQPTDNAPKLRHSTSSTSLRRGPSPEPVRRSLASPEPVRRSIPSPDVSPTSRTTSALSIDQLCDGLEKFRDRHKRATYTDRTKLHRLRDELQATLTAIDGPASANIDDLARQFGDKIVALVEQRLHQPTR